MNQKNISGYKVFVVLVVSLIMIAVASAFWMICCGRVAEICSNPAIAKCGFWETFAFASILVWLADLINFRSKSVMHSYGTQF